METKQHPPPSDEKAPLYEPFPRQQPHREMNLRRNRLLRHIIPAFLTLFAIFSLFRTTFVCKHHYNPTHQPSRLDPFEEAGGNKVPLEIHIMSKCPDARDCLRQLIIPAMVQVSEKVNFTMSYIGSIDPNSDAVSCKHGPGECLGNIIQLCAAYVYQDDLKLWLGFANCMVSNYQDIPKRDLVEDCALEHGIDFQKLNSCISDEGEGIDLLRASMQRSQENNVTKSCTVRLAGKVRCIRDGGEWYDCPGGSDVSDLVRDIDDLYNMGGI